MTRVRMMRFVSAVLVLAMPMAAGDAIAAPTPCAISAWSADPDPAGLNVRAAPRADAPVVGRLPPPRRVGGETIAVELRIVAGENGWFLIDRAEFADYGEPNKTGMVFTGRGWVSGRLLSLALNGPALHARPAADAAKRATLVGEDADGNVYGPDAFAVERLHACRDTWVEVEGRLRGPNTRHRGWTDRTCSNQVTTCP